MLLKRSELDAIKAGQITLVFRRWHRPTVKSGGTLKTAVGVLKIQRITEITSDDITKREAIHAGYDSLEALQRELAKRDGSVYRIEVRYQGADPRIALRERDQLTDSAFEEITEKLRRMDARSKVGDWTHTILKTIAQHPHVAADTLAEKTGHNKDWLKTHVRKLKNLGLTISHEPGYVLSPRGKVVLKRLQNTRN